MTTTRLLKHAALALALGCAWVCLSASALAAEPQELAGVWKSEARNPRTGNWETLSWFSVGVRDGRAAMACIDFSIVSADVSVPSPVSRVRTAGDRWTFAMASGGRPSEYSFRRVSPALYEGTMSANGQGEVRRFVRIPDRELRNELDGLVRRLERAQRVTDQRIDLARANMETWRREADRMRWNTTVLADGTVARSPTGLTGGLQSYYQIQETARVNNLTMHRQRLGGRIQEAMAERDRLPR